MDHINNAIYQTELSRAITCYLILRSYVEAIRSNQDVMEQFHNLEDELKLILEEEFKND